MRIKPMGKRMQQQQSQLPRQTVTEVNSNLEQININAAGIDIGSSEHWVCVPVDRDEQNLGSFGCFTADLCALADWLVQCWIETVAMEATGVYWMPVSVPNPGNSWF